MEIRTDRLQKALDFIKQLADVHFDLSTVTRKNTLNGSWTFHGILPALQRIASEPSVAGTCGAVGCVFGYLPAYCPEDFYWNARGSVIKIGKPVDILGAERTIDIEEFFGLTYAQVTYLFYPLGYVSSPTERVSKERVIERLESFIQQHEAV